MTSGSDHNNFDSQCTSPISIYIYIYDYDYEAKNNTLEDFSKVVFPEMEVKK